MTVDPAPFRRLCIVGLGYIGLPTAAMFATQGFEVLGVDVNEQVVRRLNQQDYHTHEPGLNTLVSAALMSRNLRAAVTPEPADAFIIAVPTPIHEGEAADGAHTKRADLSYVRAAAEAIVPHLRPGNLVLLESTVPPRTTLDVLVPILERSGLRATPGAGSDAPRVFVAHCPERVLPGNLLKELVDNDRIIGGVDRESAELARALYATFVQGTLLLTDATAAEMSKLMENTYRDLNIALANEFARIAERVQVDVWEAIALANRHPRVTILQPGPGVGGHCIAVDPWFLLDPDSRETSVIRAARELNDDTPSRVVNTLQQLLAEVPSPVVAVLGLAYKANVDDARESPAVTVVQELVRRGHDLRINDPYVERAPGINLPLLSLDRVCEGADCVVVLTNHTVYANLDPTEVARQVRRQLVLDTRHCLDRATWQQAGFTTYLLGDGRSNDVLGG